MNWQGSLLALVLLASTSLAQQPAAAPSSTTAPVTVADPAAESVLDSTRPLWDIGQPRGGGGLLTGNRDFPNFIGYMSNPLFAIDPRAQTEMYPIFESVWVRAFPALPSGSIQLYGAGLNVALTDRFSIGLNQGGYAVSNFSRRTGDTFLTFPGLAAIRDQGGSRDGWLNLGGFVQYTLIQDVPNQFLLTAGLHWESPSGEAEVFQGHGPAKLAPYVTVGKEFGDYHVLATAGYLFPTASSPLDNLFYGTVHFDRRVFGWLYPLVEFNWYYHSTSVNLNVPQLPDFISFGDFSGSGNLVALAAGFNAVIVQSRLEFGVVYQTSIAAQHDFGFNGVLAKMVARY
jgi:hypothetical protein